LGGLALRGSKTQESDVHQRSGASPSRHSHVQPTSLSHPSQLPPVDCRSTNPQALSSSPLPSPTSPPHCRHIAITSHPRTLTLASYSYGASEHPTFPLYTVPACGLGPSGGPRPTPKALTHRHGGCPSHCTLRIHSSLRGKSWHRKSTPSV
jgi:hypothetical protein